MRTARPRTRIILSGVMLLVMGSLSAQDWPQWRGPNRDGKVTGFKAPANWPKELTKKWSEKVGDGVATPALVGNKLYVLAREGSDEVIRCLNADTGKEIWKDKYPEKAASGPAGRFPGPRSTPTVADGKVVILGVSGTLSCYDADSGKMIWRNDDHKGSVPRFFTSSSPIVVDGLCIAQFGGEEQGGIAAYELANGKEKWKWTDDGTAYASPVLLTLGGTKILVAETSNKLVGLGLDGKLLWDTPFAVPKKTRGYNASSPMVEGETVIFAGSGRGTKAVKLEKKDDKLTEKEVWSNKENSVIYNTPVIKGDLLVAISDKNNLFSINTKSGKTAWSKSINGEQGYGSIVDAGSVMFSLTPKGELVVFEPTEAEFKELAKYKVASGGTYAYPVISGNRIFIKDKDSITLWTIE
jgi:outer membrane protein assembly factor BamB